MQRRDFLQLASLPLAATALRGLGPARAAAASPDQVPVVHSRWVPSANIRDHLSHEARRITEGALSDCRSARAWEESLDSRRRRFLDMMGLLDLPELKERTPLQPTITGTVERETHRIEKLHFQAVPGLYLSANLYLPSKLSGRAPGVLYVCGHSANQKVAYQAHARRFAELGFVCLLVETLETVEYGTAVGTHHGPYREGWFHWYSRGYTPAGVELLSGIRALDLLAERSEVDPARLGVTGISGGGASSWWIAAADERVRVSAPVCGTATLFSHIHDRTLDGHCDCMWWINSQRWDLADVGGLIAPRPLLIASADRDGIFTVESIREVHAQLSRLYRRLGAGEQLRLVETPGGHSYHARSRTAIFSWFLRHLQGGDIEPETVGDIDESPEHQESPETLRVFEKGVPAGHRTRSIADDLRPLPPPPDLPDRAALESTRARVVEALRRDTFGAFPKNPPPVDVQVEYEFNEDGHVGHRFAFTSEPDWRLHGVTWLRHGLTPLPATSVLIPRVPAEGRWETRSFATRVPAPWLKVEVATRGTGDTSWGADLQWHVRRAAAWTGRTLASMRVWDLLRAVEAVRSMPDAAPGRVCLAGRGEMAAIVLYAALLDGRIQTVFLESPPSTQNEGGPKDGSGPAIEMLNCLRVTDLPQVAGLLFPTEIVLLGEKPPAAYRWAEQVYQRLGAPSRFRLCKSMADWQPLP